MAWIVIGVTAALGLYMAWTIGANDVANSMADAVGSKSMSVRQAVIAAGICEFAGAVLVGSHVTETVRKGIVDPAAVTELPGLSAHEGAALLAIGMMAALLAAAIWMHAATWFGMPVSTTHSIVGAVTGFGVVAAGWSAVHWGKLGQIVASWFISPVAGAILGFVVFKLVSRFILGREGPARAAIKVAPFLVFFVVAVVALAIVYKGLKHLIARAAWLAWLTPGRSILLAVFLGTCGALICRILLRRKLRSFFEAPLVDQLDRVERTFSPLVIMTSCTVAFAHGANDVANAVGPLAAVVEILRTGQVAMKVAVPIWVLGLGGVGIVVGVATYGYRVMLTVGRKITQLTPSRGVAADIAALTIVLACSRMGLPVSTTHTLVGAILGVGLARGLGAVNKGVMRKIFTSWIITVPAAAVLSIILFFVGRLFLLGTLTDIVATAAG